MDATPSTRERIIEAADGLFYEHGFARTSFADIAAVVGLSRGNFYYHFKTKDEILEAVIGLRLRRTQSMLDSWTEKAGTPKASLANFVRMMAMNSRRIRQFGCPVGTLCTELAKLTHPAHTRANLLLALFRQWLAARFVEAGLPDDADRLAMHLLARSQGIASLAQAFDDQDFIDEEVQLLLTWLDEAIPSSQAGARARSIQQAAV